MTENSIFLIFNNTFIYWHGFFIMLGVLAGIALTCYLRLAQGHDHLNDLFISSIAALAGAFVGARFYFCWHGNDMFTSSEEYFNFCNGGYSLYGALIGSFAGLVICSLVQRKGIVEIGELLDVSVPGTALMIAIGRAGAVFSGENLGPEVTGRPFQCFPFAVYSEIEGIWRSAFFNYQSLIALIMCLASTYLLVRKYRLKDLDCHNGDIYLLFVVFFMATQGVFESFRHDPLYFNAIKIQKLQTIQAGMVVGAVCSAAALSVFILRIMWRRHFAVSSLLYVPACGVAYLCYFNIVLRLELPGVLPEILIVAGCLGLLTIGVILFLERPLHSSNNGSTRRNLPSPRHPAREHVGVQNRRNRSSQEIDYWS